jgi:outer membrane protein TolC
VTSLILIITAWNGLAFQLTEDAMVRQLVNTPAYQALQADVDGGGAQRQSAEAKFEARLKGQTSYGESREEPLFEFSPIISPLRSSTLGIEQKFPVGVSAKLEGFSDQITIPAFDVNRATRTGARLSLEIDLLGDFLGRRDGTELKNARVRQKATELNGELQKVGLLQDLRKAYWTYMGLEESLKMAQELLQSAQRQLDEIQARQKIGAADRGELARSQSQVANRVTQIQVIEFQKTQLWQELKNQYPKLQSISYQSTQDALLEVSDCVKKIKQLNQPEQQTVVTDLISLLEEEKRLSLIQANTLSDWDLKLQGLYQRNAVGEGFQFSQQGFWAEGREAYQVSLQLSIPLGGSLNRAEDLSISQMTNIYDSRIQTLRQNIITRHQRALRSLDYLQAAISAQASATKSLRQSVQSSKQKYGQARISQIEYILDQDRLFATEIDGIQNRVQIISETLDYLKTFNKSQCLFNKVAGV